MHRLPTSTLQAFHASAVALAAACIPTLTATTTGLGTGTSYLIATVQDASGQPVAASAPGATTPDAAIASLRVSLIILDLLPLASTAQREKLIRLYNHPCASYDEGAALRKRVGRLRADEAEQLYQEFRQELERRRAGRFAVVGEAFVVQRVAVAA